jgi:hypothetical protein
VYGLKDSVSDNKFTFNLECISFSGEVFEIKKMFFDMMVYALVSIQKSISNYIDGKIFQNIQKIENILKTRINFFLSFYTIKPAEMKILLPVLNKCSSTDKSRFPLIHMDKRIIVQNENETEKKIIYNRKSTNMDKYKNTPISIKEMKEKMTFIAKNKRSKDPSILKKNKYIMEEIKKSVRDNKPIFNILPQPEEKEVSVVDCLFMDNYNRKYVKGLRKMFLGKK